MGNSSIKQYRSKGCKVLGGTLLLFVFFVQSFTCLFAAEELMLQQSIKGLKDKKEKIRIESARSLGEIGKPEVVSPLREALTDKSEDVRTVVIDALSKVKDESAVSAIAVAIRDKDEDVRIAAIEALAKINFKSVIGPLIEATKDKSNEVKKMAVNILGAIGDSSVIPSLSECLNDKDTSVVLATIYAVGSIGGIDAIRSLSESVNSKNNTISIATIKVLGALGDINATPLLTSVLKQKKDEVIYNAVADALILLGDKTVIPAIVQFLDKANDKLKEKYQNAIVSILEKNRVISTKKEAIKAKEPVKVEQESKSAPAVTAEPEQQIQANSQQEKLKIMSDRYTAGVKLYQKREYEKAIAEWEEVLKIDPNHKQSKEMIDKAKKQVK